MYILYLDESGDPNAWDIQSHFVLGAVAVFEGQVRNLADQLDNIQRQFFPERQIPVAFHATDIRGGHGAFPKLPPQTRQRLMDSIYGCLEAARFPHLVAFSTAMHVSAVVSPEQALRETFQDVCLRFNRFLTRMF